MGWGKKTHLGLKRHFLATFMTSLQDIAAYKYFNMLRSGPFLTNVLYESTFDLNFLSVSLRMRRQSAGQQRELLLSRLPQRLLGVHALYLENLGHARRKGEASRQTGVAA